MHELADNPNGPVEVRGLRRSHYRINLVIEHDLNPGETDVERPPLDLFLQLRSLALKAVTPSQVFPMRIVEMDLTVEGHELSMNWPTRLRLTTESGCTYVAEALDALAIAETLLAYRRARTDASPFRNALDHWSDVTLERVRHDAPLAAALELLAFLEIDTCLVAEDGGEAGPSGA
jgi:hypothetical protein